MEDLPHEVHLLADLLSRSEARYVHLGISYEDCAKMMNLYIKRSIEDGLAVCGIDLTNDKFISITTTMDTYREIKEPLGVENLFPKGSPAEKMIDLWNELKMPKEMEPKGPGEFWGGGFSATDLEYQQFGVLARMVMYQKQLIPIGQATVMAGNNRSQGASSGGGGARVLKEVRLKDFKDRHGEKVFEGVEETCRKIGVEPFEYACLMYWDTRKGVKPSPKL